MLTILSCKLAKSGICSGITSRRRIKQRIKSAKPFLANIGNPLIALIVKRDAFYSRCVVGSGFAVAQIIAVGCQSQINKPVIASDSVNVVNMAPVRY